VRHPLTEFVVPADAETIIARSRDAGAIGCPEEGAFFGMGTAPTVRRRSSRGLQIAAIGFFKKEAL